jgi:methylated-DNA-[protein]-cysteine S-methyltransferase
MRAAQGFCVFETSIGHCAVAWAHDALLGVQLPLASEEATRVVMQRRFPLAPEASPAGFVQQVIGRICGLLQGERDTLSDVPLNMSGVPPFHQRVYEVTRGIPPGRTLTYGEVAAELGDAGAARAVGQALGHNPFAPVVPCHRVLAARNASGGFSAEGGVATKLRLLQIEHAQLGHEPGLFDCHR